MHVWKSSLAVAAMCAVFGSAAGCTVDTDEGPIDPSPNDAGLGEVHLRIAFDHRFDEAGFFDARKRRVLNAAAAAWGRILADDFAAVPAGTPLLTRDPQHPDAEGQVVVVEEEIDDLVVFVGASSLDGIGGATARSFPSATWDVADDVLRDSLRRRTEGADFEPWSGWITFDADEVWFVDESPESDGDVDGQVPDLFTTAMHELGHILGVGTAPAYFDLVDEGSGTFTGAAASAVFGGPVPVTGSGVHLQDGFEVNGEEPLMNRTDADGSRVRPTDLDVSILVDIGYERVDE